MIISRGLNPFFLFFVIALFFSQIVSCSSQEKPKNPVIPFPAKISFEQGRLEVGSEFRVILKGYVEPRLERAVQRITHRSNYSKMFERLTGEFSIDSLRVLADIVEPVKYYTRPATHEYTQHSPLNRLVDADRPESDKVRKFRNMVDRMLSDAPCHDSEKQRIRKWLVKWRDNHARLKPVMEESYLLKEIVPLSEEVSSLAEAGLEAMDSIEKNQQPSLSWVEDVLFLLYRPVKPEYELEVAIAPAISKLVERVIPPLISDDFEDGEA